MFKRERGNWALYRQRFGLSNADEIDLHFGRRDPHEYRWYDEVMADIEELVRKALRTAQENGRSYVMFVHGWSTSRPGKMTARSTVRGFMRSKEATPFIVRAACIQHETVFVAKVKQKPSLVMATAAGEPSLPARSGGEADQRLAVAPPSA
jgi:hypothetical protein